MAQCKNCGAKFGCGCQLQNGICGTCVSSLNQKIKVLNNNNSQENVTTKTN